jgi:hypothetical protein
VVGAPCHLALDVELLRVFLHRIRTTNKECRSENLRTVCNPNRPTTTGEGCRLNRGDSIQRNTSTAVQCTVRMYTQYVPRGT